MTVKCSICAHESDNYRLLAYHIRDTHRLKTREYYDRHLKKDDEGTCKCCGKPAVFKAFTTGYSLTCSSHKCAAILHRTRLREDPERSAAFSNKVAYNMRSIWATREVDGTKSTIIGKVSDSVRAHIGALTDEERVSTFSRYSKCTPDQIEYLNTRGREQCHLNMKNGKTGWRGKHAKQGMFIPSNPSKYKGRIDLIVYRSSLELKFMKYLDKHPSILEWSSEEEIVPYFDPSTNKWRRYFPDFVVKLKSRDGTVKIVMVEIKPKSQTRPPKPGTKATRRVINETLTFATNEAKWQSAMKYCEQRGWTFKIITDQDLGSF